MAPIADAHEVFTTFSNSGGWSSISLAVIARIGGLVPSLTGFDCAVHMAEEINDASRTLPQAIVYGVTISGIMGRVMAITICFTLGDVESILNTTTGYPFILVFYNATQSLPIANFMTNLVVLMVRSFPSSPYVS
jgi:amino acid transporter